jgi:DNA polymerase-3 subunit delta'
MRFADIPGLDELKQTLISSYQRNHIAHAQLFAGHEGSAVLPLVLAYISFLFCENKSATDACGTCGSCQRVHKLIHPDVHFFRPAPSKAAGSKDGQDKQASATQSLWRSFLTENPYQSLEDWVQHLDAENKQVQISKEEARNIIRTVSMKSFEGSYKVIVIWYPEIMHPSAANAILKVLEEPPGQTLYFLVSYNYEALLSTILSRTQLVHVPDYSENEIISYLVEQKKIDQPQAERLAKFCGGNLRKALNEIEHVTDDELDDFARWMRACVANQFDVLLELAAAFKAKSKSQQRIFLQYGHEMLRQALLAKAQEDLMTLSGSEHVFISKFSQTQSLNTIGGVYEELNKLLMHLARNANAQLSFMACSIRLTQIIKHPSHAA